MPKLSKINTISVLHLRKLNFIILFAIANLAIGTAASVVNEYDEHAVSHDLTSMSNIVDMRHTSEVSSYLRTYLVNNRDKTARIVKRMMLYFPLIEKKLQEHNLPDELKYLAIVESALDPHARSRSGAMGLWQIMAPTAGDLKIRMYHSVDERKDPYRSTDAALTYLSQLYDRFGDWEIALAAYNAGPNRVSKLMDKANTSDYWKLREHLPRETSNYIPAFIAASYVFSDFVKHGFVAKRSHPDFHFTSKVEIVNHKVYLRDIAELMKINVDTLKFINPMYKRDYIPESPKGYNLILPNRCLRYFYELRDTLERSEFVKLAQLSDLEEFNSTYPDSIQNIYLGMQYIVQQKENLFTVANMFDIDILQLKYWNALPSFHVDHGMIIDLPLPLVEGRFLIRDYKKIRQSDAIHLLSSNNVDTSPEIRYEYEYAKQICAKAREQYKVDLTEADNYITISKGISAQSQYATHDLNQLMQTQMLLLEPGVQLYIGD